MAAIFDEILIDPEYAPGVKGGPEFATTIIENPFSGIRQAAVTRLDAIGRWSIDYQLLSEEALRNLHKFFNCRYGMARGFRFKAPIFNQVTGETFGTGDGAKTQFGLYITDTSAGVSNAKRIVKPVAGGLTYDTRPNSVTIYKNGVAATATVSSTTGIVTFPTAPAAGVVLTWTGSYDLPVRFGTDRFGGEYDEATNSLIGSIEIIEMLPVELEID